MVLGAIGELPLEYLRQVGAVPPAVEVLDDGPVAQVLAGYREYLVLERGLAESRDRRVDGGRRERVSRARVPATDRDNLRLSRILDNRTDGSKGKLRIDYGDPHKPDAPVNSWSSHKDHAAKALKKLAGPHLPGSLRQLESAIKRAHEDCARAEREAHEAPQAALPTNADDRDAAKNGVNTEDEIDDLQDDEVADPAGR